MAAVVVKMGKDEFRAKWTAAQIKAELDEVYEDSAPALKTVYFWINEFKRGLTSTKDEARFRHLVEVTTEMIEKNLSYCHGRSPNEGA
ncbi:hypothetical protein P5V15_001425 [Pogonomyrmex californicus]